MMFTFGTLCSGIEAASEAFRPLGAECVYVSEIEPYPCGVLADRHGAGKPMRMPAPDEAADEKTRRDRVAAIKTVDRFPRWANRLPNYGDLTQIDPEELPAVDLLVAGFPCQDFSIAGLRQSLEGARGNLTLYGVKLIHELVRLRRVRSILLEQVPDILNTKDNAFGALLGGIVGHDAPIRSPLKGGRWTNAGVADGPLGTAAWRVEDAQYSGLAQRRERLFLVASFGDGPDPVEVLFERQGLSRNPPARRQAGEGIARPADEGPALPSEPAGRAEDGRPTPFGCDYGQDIGRPIVAPPCGYRSDVETETVVVAHSLRGEGFDASEDGTGRGTPLVPVIAGTLGANGKAAGSATSQDADSGLLVPVTYSIMPMNSGTDYKARVVDVAQPLMASGPVGGDQGGDYVVQPVAFSCKDHGADAGDIAPTMRAMGHGASHPNADGQIAVAIPINPNALRGDGEAKTPSADAAGNVRLRDPGLGVGEDGDPADTLQASGPGAVAVAFSLRGREGGAMPEIEDGDVVPALRAAEGGSTRPFVAFDETQITSKANRSNPKPGDPCHPLAAGPRPPTIAGEMAVRRITCLEAEALMGFRPGYTLIDWPTGNRKGDDLAEMVSYLIGHSYSAEEAAVLAQTPDGPRYKALGNSKAVPHVRKIGERYAAALARYLAAKEAA